MTPETARDTGVSDAEKERAEAMAGRLSMPVLTRCWQMLLKGHGEVRMAGQPLTALEMLLIRLCYVADLPPPAEIVKALNAGDGTRLAAPQPAAPAGNGGMTAIAGGGPALASANPEPVAQPSSAPEPQARAAPALTPPRSFEDAVELFAEHREMMLYTQLRSEAHLVAFEPGHIEIRPTDAAPQTLANRVGALLTEWTGTRWVVSVSQAAGAPTLRDLAETADAALKAEAAQNPVVQAVLETFPAQRSPRSATWRRTQKRLTTRSTTCQTACPRAATRRQTHEESRPADEAGAGDAGQDAGDAGTRRRG